MFRWTLFAFGSLACLAGCAFDWGSLDPRVETGSGAGGGGGTQSTGGTSSSGGGTSTSTTGTGGTGGLGGMGGAGGAEGGAGGTMTAPMCFGETVPVLANGVAVLGSTLQAPGQLEGACASTTGGEAVFALILTATADVTVTTELAGTTYDTVLHVRQDCTDRTSEVGCLDGGSGDTLVLPALPAGTYFVVVDSHSIANEGNFELETSW
jgi:hypothetical protein